MIETEKKLYKEEKQLVVQLLSYNVLGCLSLMCHELGKTYHMPSLGFPTTVWRRNTPRIKYGTIPSAAAVAQAQPADHKTLPSPEKIPTHLR